MSDYLKEIFFTKLVSLINYLFCYKSEKFPRNFYEQTRSLLVQVMKQTSQNTVYKVIFQVYLENNMQFIITKRNFFYRLRFVEKKLQLYLEEMFEVVELLNEMYEFDQRNKSSGILQIENWLKMEMETCLKEWFEKCFFAS